MPIKPRYRAANLRNLRNAAPRWTVPVPPADEPVEIVTVEYVSTHQLRWTFSAPVTAVAANVPELQASVFNNVYFSPVSTTLDTGNSSGLLANYAINTPSLGGSAVYQVVAIPTGITFTPPSTPAHMALPLIGVVANGGGGPSLVRVAKAKAARGSKAKPAKPIRAAKTSHPARSPHRRAA